LNSKATSDDLPILVRKGIDIFGGWDQALLAAGFNPSIVRKKVPKTDYSREPIIKIILELKSQGEDLRCHALFKKHSAMMKSAVRIFGSHKAMCEAAGISLQDIGAWDKKCQAYTRENIIDYLKDLRIKGEDLRCSALYKKHTSMKRAAVRIFGSHKAMCEAAGISLQDIGVKERKPQKQHTRYTDNELLEYLQQLMMRGISISFANVRNIDSAMTQNILRRYGTYKKAIETLGLDYNEIRKDRYMESFKGMIFERYAKEIFDLIGWKVEHNKLHRFEKEKCRPDFVDLSNGTWIDAKINSFSDGVEKSIAKYLKHSNKIIIVFLNGRKRIWTDGRVDFIPISDFYGELRRKEGGEEIIHDIEKLRKGVLRQELQSELDRFMKRQLKKAS
jgi:hypothetical protein